MDAIELDIKLSWAERELEEKSGLIAHLREDVTRVLDENTELIDKITKLKVAQEQLLHDKLEFEQKYHQALKEKAELASENARLHIYAREAGAKAEMAIKAAEQLRSIADARAKADVLLLEGRDGANGSHGGMDGDGADDQRPETDAAPSAPLHAARILIARLLLILQKHHIDIDSELVALSSDPTVDALRETVGGSLSAARIQSELEAGLTSTAVSSNSKSQQLNASAASGTTDTVPGIGHGTVEEKGGPISEPRPASPGATGGALTTLSTGFWKILVGDLEQDALSPQKSRPASTLENGEV